MTSFALVAALVLAAAPSKKPSTAKPGATTVRTLKSLTVTIPTSWKANDDINKQSVDAMKGALKGAYVDGAFYAAPDFGMAYQLLYLRTEKIPAQNVQAELKGVGAGFKQSETSSGSTF